MNRKLTINFVPATEKDIFGKKLEQEKSCHESQKPNASEMYKEVLSMPSTSNQHSVDSLKTYSSYRPILQSKLNFKATDIFRFCQHGELKLCKQWLIWGGDVNIRDQFQWTPLMVAVSEGHRKIVELLIQSGANPTLCDAKNLNAYDHAKKSGHEHLISAMEKMYKKQNEKKELETQTHFEKTETNLTKTAKIAKKPTQFECDACGLVTGQSKDVHLLSITHQLKNNDFSSEKTRKLGSFAHVNPRFMGYQMLRREGWNGYTGLGAREDGRKYPVQAQPNPGRACIGLPTQPKPEPVQTQSTTNALLHSGKLKHRLKREDQKKRQFIAEYRRSFY